VVIEDYFCFGDLLVLIERVGYMAEGHLEVLGATDVRARTEAVVCKSYGDEISDGGALHEAAPQLADLVDALAICVGWHFV